MEEKKLQPSLKYLNSYLLGLFRRKIGIRRGERGIREEKKKKGKNNKKEPENLSQIQWFSSDHYIRQYDAMLTPKVTNKSTSLH